MGQGGGVQGAGAANHGNLDFCISSAYRQWHCWAWAWHGIFRLLFCPYLPAHLHLSCASWSAHSSPKKTLLQLFSLQHLFSCHSQNDNFVCLRIFDVHLENWVAQKGGNSIGILNRIMPQFLHYVLLKCCLLETRRRTYLILTPLQLMALTFLNYKEWAN